LLSQNLSLLITPFVTGMVGYGTNWLAIKMLFRPHKKSLWSFGWQGVIPKNRAKLAKEIGELVGDKLLRKKDIQEAFFGAAVQSKLEKAVEHELKTFLEKDFGSVGELLAKTGYRPKTIITVLLDSLHTSGFMDEIFRVTADGVKDRIYSYKIGDLEQYKDNISQLIETFLSSQRIQEETGSAVSAYINNFVMSGKSLADIVPESLMSRIPAVSSFITDKILTSMESAFDDERTRGKISAKLVELKDGHFGEGTFDKMKLGFLNMFLNEDTIRDIVDKYMPTLIKSIKDSDDIKQKINNSITEYIKSVAEKPLYMHAGSIGLENIYSLKSSLVTTIQKAMGSEDIVKKISGKIMEYAAKNPEKTLGDILHDAGADTLISDKINGAFSPNISKMASVIASAVDNIKISNIYQYIPKKMFSRIKSAFIKEINKIIEKNTDNIVSSVNFPKITENRINSLDLYEVEKLLFSFMSDSFKWINILGFVLGFLFGALQSALIYIIS